MSVIDYTTYDSIRATMGVDKFEITDEVLSSPFLSAGLNRILSSVSGTFAPDTEERTLAEHHAHITALVATPILEDPDDPEIIPQPTQAQKDLLETIEAYATYVVAGEVVVTLPMAAPKTKSDGKSSATRFSSEATFRDVISSVRYGAMALRDSLIVSLGGRVSSLTYVVAGKPTFNPYSS